MNQRFFCLLLSSALAVAVAPRALAQADDPAALERAKAHFTEGVRLYDAKDFSGALEKFRAAYKERPSPGIKRNMALCLRALGRTAEAVTQLDEMLLESKDPRERAAAEQAIAEMSSQIASARLQIVVRASPTATTRPVVSVTVDGQPFTRFEDQVRLMPGEHTFVGTAPGYIEGSEKITVKAGDRDVPVKIELAASDSWGRIVVHASRPDTQITVDGALAPTQGGWSGFLPAGKHVLQLEAPGSPPLVKTIDVVANRTDNLAIEIDGTRDTPPEYQGPGTPAKKPDKKWYALAGLQLQGQVLTVTRALGELQPTRRSFSGVGLTARGGRLVAPSIGVEVHGELGVMSTAKGTSPMAPSIDYEANITNWTLAAATRFRSPGKVRVYMLTGLGLEGHIVKASFGTQTTPGASQKTNASASGLSGMGLAELGLQTGLGLNNVLVDLGAFVDVHGIGTYTDSVTRERFFLDSPAWRYGLRLGFGAEF